MSKRYHFSTLETMRSLAQEKAPGVEFSKDLSILKIPLEIDSLSFPNRIAIQPLEAADADSEGAPTPYTKERYLKYAEGGAGLIWFEACSLDYPEARSHEKMLVISKKTLSSLKNIVNEVKEVSKKNLNLLGSEGRAVLVLQLNHAGRYRATKSKRSPAMSFRFPEVDNAFGITEDIGRVLLDSELDDLKSVYLEASIMASKAGFDAVDIKACHGYLLNDLLAGGNRNGKYGKSFENRTRFLLDVIKTVKEETDIVVTSRLSAYDGFPPPYGFGSSQNVDECTGLAEFDPSEPTRLLNEMINQGVKFVNISLGNPYYSQYITRPFDTKMPGQRDSPFHPIKGVKKHFECVETLKKRVPKMMFVGSGYSWLRQYSAYAAAYNIQNGKADIAGWGRLAIAFPHFPRSIFESNNIPASKTCITCSGCSRLLRARLRSGCIIQNKEEYRDSIRGLSTKARKLS